MVEEVAVVMMMMIVMISMVQVNKVATVDILNVTYYYLHFKDAGDESYKDQKYFSRA